MRIIPLILILIILLVPNVYSLMVDSDYEISEYSDLINVTNKDKLIGKLTLLFPQEFERDIEYSFSLETDLGPFVIKDIRSVDLNTRVESTTIYFSKPTEFRNTVFHIGYEIDKPSKKEGWGIYSIDFKAFCQNDCSEMDISVLFPIKKYRITSYIGEVEPFWLNSDKFSSDFVFRQTKENEVRGRIYFEDRLIRDKLVPLFSALIGAIFGFLIPKIFKLLKNLKNSKMSKKIPIKIWKEDFVIAKSKKFYPDAFANIKDGKEITIIIEESKINTKEFIEIEKEWKLITFETTLPFNTVGFIARVSKELAKEGISIFVISSFSTDHILVKKKDLEKARKILEKL